MEDTTTQAAPVAADEETVVAEPTEEKAPEAVEETEAPSEEAAT